MQRLEGLLRKAVQDYEMIAPGDRVCVGVSGGKDSVALTVALGHHLDDAVETFYMNLWREGRIGCFSPVTYLDQRNITLIRPMIFATESEVKSAVSHAGLPIIKSRCPADGATVREQTKLFVQQMSRDDPAFRQKTLHALQQSGIDGWRPLHTGRTRG